MLAFQEGVDCGAEYFFDRSTKKLVAVTASCDGFGIVSCVGAAGCFPNRCMPVYPKIFGNSPDCPLPDAG